MKFIVALIIIFSLAEDATLSEAKWYSREVMFSDWRNVEHVDYSTNAVVTDWYSPGHSKYFRAENIGEIAGRLEAGDTLIIGMDYYALFPISGRFINPVIINDIGANLARGEVIRFKTYKTGDNYSMERLN